MSRGNLTIPSPSSAEIVSNGFAILDSVDHKISTFKSISTRTAAEYVLKKYSQPVRFTCEDNVEWEMHCSITFTCEGNVEWGMHYSIKMIITILQQ